MNSLPPNPYASILAYVTRIFQETISPILCFHNFQHTMEVLEASKEICGQCHLSAEETEVVLIAACFHDTGYRTVYLGHEEESKKIAANYLSNIHYREDRLQQVLACIEATKYPYQPQGIQQQVLCDADLYHLSRSDYPIKEALLRMHSGK